MDGNPDYFAEDYIDFEYLSDLDGDGWTDFFDHDRDGDGINGGWGESHVITEMITIWFWKSSQYNYCNHYNVVLGIVITKLQYKFPKSAQCRNHFNIVIELSTIL